MSKLTEKLADLNQNIVGKAFVELPRAMGDTLVSYAIEQGLTTSGEVFIDAGNYLLDKQLIRPVGPIKEGPIKNNIASSIGGLTGAVQDLVTLATGIIYWASKGGEYLDANTGREIIQNMESNPYVNTLVNIFNAKAVGLIASGFYSLGRTMGDRK